MNTKTCGDIITRVDVLEPNQYSQNDKLAWLSQLDGQIFEELILTHEHPHGATFEPYSMLSDHLLVPEPYGSEMYLYYLQAMIADQNGETAKYNQQISLYNVAYLNYANRYNRTHRPIRIRGGNRLRF